ncbi:Ig-like domain-containing protein [Paenibacillus alba]|uniref:Ig-like domain-containing protein n=1 Tax=Paenibacillus alba TaxID=1197127 RepID=A0ABU6FZ62_9BACL|nr:Ig-like domain-containing protein [Paenibacillus alba]MEC0226660.1 Ig-like domain-containing protein [Paenibacillus alba]
MNKVRYRLRWLCLVCFVSLLGSLHQPAYAATTVSNQITGDSASVYGGRVEFTSTVTDASGGGSTPTGNVAFYDGAMLIGTGDLVEDEPIVVNKPAGAAPTQPDLKLTCSNCPVIQWGGLSFWAYSFYENTEEIQLIGYDANNQIVKSWKITGDRYVEGITIDKSARLITFKGQRGNVISRTWDQLENFSAHASIVVPNLTAGAHSITSSYTGDGSHAAQTASPFIHTVSKLPTATTLSSNNAVANFGEPITFTAYVSNTNGSDLPPTAQVTFKANGSVISPPVNLDGNGIATLITASLPVGSLSITAEYSGDANHGASLSTPVTQYVTNNPLQVELTVVPPTNSHFQYGDPISFTASVGGLIGDQGQPGSISLRDNGVEKARVTADVYGGKEIVLTGVSSGTHHFTAIYEREGITNGITSQEVVVVVHPVLTQLQLKQGAEENVLPAIAPWLATVIHGPNDTINLTPTSAEANTGIRIWKQDPQSGVLGAEIGVMNGQSEAIRLTEGLNRLAIKAASSDATVAAETVLSIFYTPDDHPWDMWQVLHVMSLEYNMDGIPTFDKADVNELLKLIEPITRS